MPAANAETMSLHLTAIGARSLQVATPPSSSMARVSHRCRTHHPRQSHPHALRLRPELNPIENVWEYLRGNKLAITVFDDYDDIVDKTCVAWNFFADDPKRIASITLDRGHGQSLGRWYNFRRSTL